MVVGSGGGGLIAMDNDLCDLVAPPLVGSSGNMF